MSEETDRSKDQSINVTAGDFMPNPGTINTNHQRTMDGNGRAQDTYPSLSKSQKVNKVNPPMLKQKLSTQNAAGFDLLHPHPSRPISKTPSANRKNSSSGVSRKSVLLLPGQSIYDLHPESNLQDTFAYDLAKKRQDEFQKEKEMAKARIEPIKQPLMSEQLSNIGDKHR